MCVGRDECELVLPSSEGFYVACYLAVGRDECELFRRLKDFMMRPSGLKTYSSCLS